MSVIYKTYFKRIDRLYQFFVQFPSLTLVRVSDDPFSPYRVNNTDSAQVISNLSYLHLQHHLTENDIIVGFDNVEGSIFPIDDFGAIVIEIYRGDEVEEIRCNRALLQQKKIHCKDKTTRFESELFICPTILSSDYNLCSYPPVFLSQECNKVVISPYFIPRPIPFDNTKRVYTPKYYPSVESNFPQYYNRCYGVRKPISSICISQRISEKLLFLYHSEIVEEREYKVISHASMDPGPDEVSEWTSWGIKLCIQFSSRLDMSDFLKKIGAVETKCDWNNLSNNEKLYQLTFDKPIDLKDLESIVGFHFIETWSTDSAIS